MDDCSQHKKEVAGISDMKVLGKAIVDMHYESLTELMKEISINLNLAAKKDALDSKINLANKLMSAGHYAELTYLQLQAAWIISKHFMEKEKQ